jgi:membrane protein implicated in regulation of membrane protease activity
MVLPWVFGGLMVLSGGFLIISLIVGEIAEGAGDALDGLDNLLEGAGIDLIPDNLQLGEEQKGIGCTSIAAFLTGFGAAGLVASLNHLGTVASILAALVFGLVAGGLYVVLMGFISRQQANTTIGITDFVGLKGRMTVGMSAGKVGQVALTVRGEMKTFPAVETTGEALNKGDAVEIVNLEGGRLYVKKTE